MINNVATPYGCTINGVPCAGGPAAGDITPPTRPADLQVVEGTDGKRYLQWTQSTDDTAVYQYVVDLRVGYTGRQRHLVAPWTFHPTRIFFVDLTDVWTVTVRARDAAFNYSQSITIDI